jgi:Family of unknown function (DUF6519)
MKGDFSRETFAPERHYASVRMQQGRVLLDADWNEQADLTLYRAETGALDVVGGSGAPLHAAGFGVSLSGSAGDFSLGAGRFYVDGILCENESPVFYSAQPDFPGAPALDPSRPGFYVVYLDVWRRHLAALDTPAGTFPPLRETALGGPDTSTRARTVWQVRTVFAGTSAVSCIDTVAALTTATAASTGRMSARAQQESSSTDPCVIPPGAGFRGLENQLYRAEIHTPGSAYDLTAGPNTASVDAFPRADQVKVGSGTWSVGQAVEVFLSAAGRDPTQGFTAFVTAVAGSTLTLNATLPSLSLADAPRIRRVGATFKWSRDNGIVLTAVRGIAGSEVTVADFGADDVLGLRDGDWVEVIDDLLELTGRPGPLAQVASHDPAASTLTLTMPPAGVDATRNARLRRWDGVGAVKANPPAGRDGFVSLENGVQVRFETGTYATGDYWQIPARTANADALSGNVQWPVSGGQPAPRAPFGVAHHFARLAVVQWTPGANPALAVTQDCRLLFPPVTELTALRYVGGGGQEALPGSALVQPLQAAVYNGRWPVQGARIRFAPAAGTPQGLLALVPTSGPPSFQNVASLDVSTGADGVASCLWQPANTVSTPVQRLEATLLSAANQPLPQVVRFDGMLSLASQVAYDATGCTALAGQNTVQAAVSRLASLAAISIVSGNGQELVPGAALAPLKVLVSSACGPVTGGLSVRFAVASGTGTLNGGAGPVTVNPGSDGTAAVTWAPDATNAYQEVTATLVAGTQPIGSPSVVRFTAVVNAARLVGYTPDPQCSTLLGKTTVQSALDALCLAGAGESPGIHVTDVRLVSNSAPVPNDSSVSASALALGLAVTTDAPVLNDTLGSKPTCQLVLYLPFPDGISTLVWNSSTVLGTLPLVVEGTASSSGNVITWLPSTRVHNWMIDSLPGYIASRGPVLAMLILRGNFIWGRDNAALYLDGDTFGVAGSAARTSLVLPSGDRRRGGDFRMWFRVVQPAQAPYGVAQLAGIGAGLLL